MFSSVLRSTSWDEEEEDAQGWATAVTCTGHAQLNERERRRDRAEEKMLGRPNVRREKGIGKERREGKVVFGPGLFEMDH